jgi:hypothetical protein
MNTVELVHVSAQLDDPMLRLAVASHWSTMFVSALTKRALMHPRCHQVIALLA